MKKFIKTAALIAIFAFVSCFLKGSVTVFAEEDVKDIGTKVVTDINKTWTVSFRSAVDLDSLNNSVHVEDLTDGSSVKVSVSKGEDESLAKISAPSGGYKIGHKYKLIIDKKSKSKKGKNLSKDVVLNFNVASKDNNSYTVSGKVLVSPVIPAFKQITITSTNLPDVYKYGMEGNNNIFSIGQTAISVVGSDTVKIYLYDVNGNKLGTSTMSVGTTKDNIDMNISLE